MNSINQESESHDDRTLPVMMAAFFLSGCSSLGFEMVWLRLLGLGLGHESVAMLGALAGFFGGLGLGAWLLDGVIRRAQAPARLFVRLELAVAVFGIVSPYWLFWLSKQLPALLGGLVLNNNSPVALAVSVLVAGAGMLPGTLCMGATLPALVEARRRMTSADSYGSNVGWLYGANTFGAAVGLLAAVYFILPWLGFGWGTAALAALNIASALLVWRAIREHAAPAEPDTGSTNAPAGRPYALAVLVLTGLAGLGMEVVGVQIVSQVLYGTVYSFAAVTFAYLIGTAVGGLVYGRWLHQVRMPFWTLAHVLLLGAALAAVASAFVLRHTPVLLRLLDRAGGSVPLRMAGELVVGAVAFLLPVAILGMLYPHLMSVFAGRSFGRAYGLNMIGAMLAPLVFGVAAVSALGYTAAFYAAAAVLFVLALGAMAFIGERRTVAIRAVAVALIAIALAPRSLLLVRPEPNWLPIFQRESLFGVVEVSELEGSESTHGFPARQLRLNTHHYMGGGVSFGERRMGYVPALLKPEARTVLFLGVGTGATLSSLSGPRIEHVDAVEIVPEIVETLPYFDKVNESIAENPRVTFHTADARRFVAAVDQSYDLIVADLFHPGRDGAGSLYTREHFEQVRARLSDGGLFAQWLPLYQLDEPNLKTIIRTFLAVFPEAQSFIGLYNTEYTPLVLLGAAPGTPIQLDATAYEASRRTDPKVDIYFESIHDFLAAYMLDAGALAQYAGLGPLNTDMNPRILFDAPRSAYELTLETQQAMLKGLFAARSPLPEGFVAGVPVGPDFNERTASFSKAVGLLLEGDMAWRAGVTREGLDRLVDRYIEACAAAPDFSAPRTALIGLMGLESEVDDRIRKALVQMRLDAQ